MKNPCRHRNEDTLFVAGIKWCKECGAIRDNGDDKRRWKSPARSVFDMQRILEMGKKEGRKELQQQLCELLGAGWEGP